VELTPDEHQAVGILNIIVEREGKEVVIEYTDIQPGGMPRGENKFKLYIAKMEKYVADRPKVDIPIEAEMPGGKEIIGYDQKPESVIVEKTVRLNQVESQLKE